MAYISPPLVANATWGIMIRKTCNNNDGDRECNVEDNKCDSVTTLMLLTMGATHIVMVILKKTWRTIVVIVIVKATWMIMMM